MKKYENIFEYEKLLTDNVIITGGHFMIQSDGKPKLNAGTIKSFEIAAKLYQTGKEKKLKKIGLGILINDIGTTCSKSIKVCNLNKISFSRKQFSLPKQYEDILFKNKIKLSELDIFWEKHIRNVSKKEFNRRKNKNKGLKIIGNNYYILDKNGYGYILLTRISENDKYGTPACPLIMAGFAAEQTKRGYKNSLNIYYTANDNLSNIPNSLVIEKGSRVAKLFGINLKIRNIYIK